MRYRNSINYSKPCFYSDMYKELKAVNYLILPGIGFIVAGIIVLNLLKKKKKQ